MGSNRYTPEQIKAMSERMKAVWASLTPEEHAAWMAKFRDPKASEHAHKQLTEFWANCTGEARAKKCAHLTNPEAQAKSHEAQRTPEFLAKKSVWAKAAWARLSEADKAAYAARNKEAWERRAREGLVDLTPEEVAEILAEKRKAVGRFLAEQRNKRRAERGLPPERPIGSPPPKSNRPKLSPEELLAVKRASIAKFWASHQEIRERAAAKRAAKEAERLARKEARAKAREEARKKRAVLKELAKKAREEARKARTEGQAKVRAERMAARMAERLAAREARAAEKLARREAELQALIDRTEDAAELRRLAERQANLKLCKTLADKTARLAAREAERQARKDARIKAREAARQARAVAKAKACQERQAARQAAREVHIVNQLEKREAELRAMSRQTHDPCDARRIVELLVSIGRCREQGSAEAKLSVLKEVNAEMLNRRCNKAIVGYPKKGRSDPPIRFTSATSAAQYFVSIGRAKSISAVRLGISNVIHGRRESAFGYVWKIA